MLIKKSALIVILLTLVLGSAWIVKAEIESKARFNPEAFHINHDENGVDCESCHLQPYKSNGWVKVGEKGIVSPSIGKLTMPQNLSREVDKTQCLECHRWGADNRFRFYGGEPAEAGDLYEE